MGHCTGPRRRRCRAFAESVARGVTAVEGLWTPADRTLQAIGSHAIEACSRCRAHLGLLAPTISRPAKCWLCDRCGSAYFAVRTEKHRRASETHARPVVYDQVIEAATIETDDKPVPRRELNDVLRYLASLETGASEKRRQPRYPIAIPVRGLPLDRNFRVTGAAMELTTINLSCGGASLINARPCEAAFLAVDLSRAGLGVVQALLEVLRVRPCSRRSKLPVVGTAASTRSTSVPLPIGMVDCCLLVHAARLADERRGGPTRTVHSSRSSHRASLGGGSDPS